MAIVGGSKVSTKLTVLDALADKVDTLIVGGGIANTFIAADGHDVGKSLYEADMLDTARALAVEDDDRAEYPGAERRGLCERVFGRGNACDERGRGSCC